MVRLDPKINYRTEVVAGATTFLTMAYIMFANPNILSAAGMDKDALIAVTCLAAGLASILMGVFSNTPIAMAPGMGLNAYFAYSIVLGENVSWQTALGIVFIAGIVFFILTIFGLRQRLVDSIPRPIVFAISVGIGLFITFMGLTNIGIVVDNPATLVSAGPMTPTVIIGLAGFLVMIILAIVGIKGALIIGILFSTLAAIIFGYVSPPETIITTHIDITPLFFKLDILGALKGSLIGVIFSLFFIDMFDTVGTIIACGNKAGLVDEKGNMEKSGVMLGVDATATVMSSVLGTSPTTSYIESGAGIEAGGRTGWTSITTGVLFLLGMLFIPVIGIVPQYATGPALIMVGLFMVADVTQINFTRLDEAFPSFIIIIMIALSYSISTGLAFGFISYVLIKTFSGKLREVRPAMWIIAVLSILFFVL